MFIFIIHSSDVEYLGSFHFLAIVNIAAMNMAEEERQDLCAETGTLGKKSLGEELQAKCRNMQMWYGTM